MTSRLNPYGISAYAWQNALGNVRWLGPGDASPAEWLLDRRGLTEAAFGLPFQTYWGRVPTEPAALPAHIVAHASRTAELWNQSLEALRAPLERAIQRWGQGRVGLVVGSSTGGIDRTGAALGHLRKTGKLPDDYDYLAQHTYDALLRLTQKSLGIEGPSYVVSTACSSGGKAIATAQRLIDAGLCDAVVTGGVDALCQMTLRGFSCLGILSSEACKPFDAERNGISIGEGSAILLIERESDSELAVLSAGESSDAYHTTAPHPEGLGARLAMERALTIAGLSADAVDYVNAHGTGTKHNDSAEALAMAAVLSDRIVFSSTKDRVGHQLGAAGATEAAFCLDALRCGRLPENRPPTARDAELAVQPLTLGRGAPLRTVLSNSFAFGGSNVAVALGKRSASEREVRDARLPGQAYVRRVSFWSPGYASFEAYRNGRYDAAVERPSAELLPPRPRGRASLLTRMAAEMLEQLVGKDPKALTELPTIHASAAGEMATTLSLLEQIGDPAGLSPAKFQSSVHNTAGGQLSIATENRAFSTALAAGTDTVAMALTEALAYLAVHGGSIAVLASDEEAPTTLMRGVSFPAAGIGFLLTWSESAPEGALGVLRGIERGHAAPQTEGITDALSATTAAQGLELARAAFARRAGRFALGAEWLAHFEPAST